MNRVKTLRKGAGSEWTTILWVSALVLAIFGFSGLAGTASWIVEILTVVFAILFLCPAVLFRPHD